MAAPHVLALPLAEAVRRLEEAGYTYDVESLLPPRDSEEYYAEDAVRKYVVRQRELSANRLALTIVYR